MDGLAGRVVRTALFSVIVPATAIVYLPRLVLSISGGAGESPWRPLGLIPIAIGGVLVLWTLADFLTAGRGTPAPFDPPRRLVSGALYAWVRNPMYLAVTTILFGEAVLFWSLTLLLLAAATRLVFHLAVVLYEEPGLRARFGASYESYTRRVPRWLPRRPRDLSHM